MQNEDQERLAFLFRFVPAAKRLELAYDEESLFSVTDQVTADKITRDILRFLPRSSTIVDACACIGGNAISFANKFAHVVAIEIDPVRTEFLKSNLKLLGISNVTCINMDCMKWIKEATDIKDVIFIDCPWGGKGYKNNEKTSLFLSGKPLALVVRELSLFTRYIALKVPMNFDDTSFISETYDVIELKHKNTQLRKMNFMLFRVLPQRSSLQQE